MKIDLDVPIRFKEQVIEGSTVENILFQFLSNYGGFNGKLKAGISNILGKIANSEDEIELNSKEIDNLRKAWEQLCEDENYNIPLMYDEAIGNLLEDIEG